MNGVWALSGGIASGKSTVAKMLEARGAVVIDADQIAREVVEPKTPGLQEIVQVFGNDVLHQDGTLNREELGRRIFASPEQRSTLNAILHPKIFMRSLQRMQEELQGQRSPVFYDAALLVENGAYTNFEGLVIVAADQEIQIDRLRDRNQLSREESIDRIEAQLPLSKKVEVADFVIWNNDDLPTLEARVDEVLAAIRAKTVARKTTETV